MGLGALVSMAVSIGVYFVVIHGYVASPWADSDFDATVPAEFPAELLPDVKSDVFAVDRHDGAIHVMASSNGTLSPIVEDFLPRLASLGWVEAPHEPAEYESPFETIHKAFERNDETFEAEFTRFDRANHLLIELTYSNDRLRSEYENALQAAIEGFGEDEPEARAALEAMFEAYAQCATYRDRGTVSIYEDPEGRRPSVSPDGQFVTAYDSETATLRFEYIEDEEYTRAILHRDSEGSRGKMSEEIEHEPLEHLLVSSYGICHGVPGTVIPLLLAGEYAEPEGLSDRRGITGGMVRVRDGGAAEVRGVPCFGIKGIDEEGRQFTLWIAKETNLIRQIREVSWSLGPDDLTVYTFDAEFDVELGRKEMEFQPNGVLKAKPSSRGLFGWR